MENNFDYYNDRKYCPDCNEYVHYLMSIERSYCVQCGTRVRLFSKDDWESFNEALAKQKGRGRGRRRKTGTDDRKTGTA